MKPETLKEVELEEPFKSQYSYGLESFPLTAKEPTISLYRKHSKIRVNISKSEYEETVKKHKENKYARNNPSPSPTNSED